MLQRITPEQAQWIQAAIDKFRQSYQVPFEQADVIRNALVSMEARLEEGMFETPCPLPRPTGEFGPFTAFLDCLEDVMYHDIVRKRVPPGQRGSEWDVEQYAKYLAEYRRLSGIVSGGPRVPKGGFRESTERTIRLSQPEQNAFWAGLNAFYERVRDHYRDDEEYRDKVINSVKQFEMYLEQGIFPENGKLYRLVPPGAPRDTLVDSLWWSWAHEARLPTPRWNEIERSAFSCQRIGTPPMREVVLVRESDDHLTAGPFTWKDCSLIMDAIVNTLDSGVFTQRDASHLAPLRRLELELEDELKSRGSPDRYLTPVGIVSDHVWDEFGFQMIVAFGSHEKGREAILKLGATRGPNRHTPHMREGVVPPKDDALSEEEKAIALAAVDDVVYAWSHKLIGQERTTLMMLRAKITTGAPAHDVVNRMPASWYIRFSNLLKARCGNDERRADEILDKLMGVVTPAVSSVFRFQNDE
jgi:hypothetical protein